MSSYDPEEIDPLFANNSDTVGLIAQTPQWRSYCFDRYALCDAISGLTEELDAGKLSATVFVESLLSVMYPARGSAMLRAYPNIEAVELDEYSDLEVLALRSRFRAPDANVFDVLFGSGNTGITYYDTAVTEQMDLMVLGNEAGLKIPFLIRVDGGFIAQSICGFAFEFGDCWLGGVGHTQATATGQIGGCRPELVHYVRAKTRNEVWAFVKSKVFLGLETHLLSDGHLPLLGIGFEFATPRHRDYHLQKIEFILSGFQKGLL